MAFISFHLYLFITYNLSIFCTEYQVHTITCKVRSRPPPVVRIGRNDGRDVIVTNGTVSAGGRGISFRMDTPDDNDFTFDAVMTISDFRERDSAKYYCNAENEMGTAAKDFPVKVRQRSILMFLVSNIADSSSQLFFRLHSTHN